MLLQPGRGASMDDWKSADVAYWHRGQPARRLASFVRPMQDALRVSVAEAEQALWPPLMSEGYESLLVLHPVRPVELIADYAVKLTNDRLNRQTGILQRRPAERINLVRSGRPLLEPERHPVVPWVADDLAVFWLNRDAATTPIDRPPGLPEGAFLGILEADARRLWPELFGDAESRRHAGRTPQVVQPAGGAWPHLKGVRWTEAERAALFLMRHRDKRTGAELASIAGVSRQAIDEVIGPERPHGGLANLVAQSGDWRPPVELLAECGATLQPLQSAAALLSAG